MHRGTTSTVQPPCAGGLCIPPPNAHLTMHAFFRIFAVMKEVPDRDLIALAKRVRREGCRASFWSKGLMKSILLAWLITGALVWLVGKLAGFSILGFFALGVFAGATIAPLLREALAWVFDDL